MLDTVSLKKFEDYLRYERNSSDNTIASYMRDMRQLSEYLDSHDMSNLIDASEKELNSLLEPGRAIAEKIYERHVVLSRMLMALGVDEKTALEDACKIEHDLSDESFEKITRHALGGGEQ